MKNYVIISHNTNDNRAQYYMGLIRGSYYFTDNVINAKRFDIEEIANIVKTNLALLGISIVRIEDCTFEKLETDEELQDKYRDFLYVAR